MTILQLAKVTKSFPAGAGGVKDLSLVLAPGECLAILGPSGSGKTTLLRLIAGLERPDSGTIHIGGIDVMNVPPHERGVALVPQKPALYPQMTVRELITSPVALRPSPVSTDDVIQILNLESLLTRRPHELSGGERQRVSLARAVIRGAKVWLLDEPFAPLDPPFRAEFRHRLHLIAARCAATILFVTHDPVDAWALGRRVGVLGDGRLQCLGTPDALAARPGNRFVAFCLGRFCFVDGKAAGERFESDDGSVTGPVPPFRAKPKRVTLGVRPGDVTKGPVEGPAIAFRGWTASADEPDGDEWNLTLVRGDARIVARGTEGSPPIGESNDWFCPADRCEWFDGESGVRLSD